MLVIPFGKKPDDDDIGEKLGDSLSLKEDKYDILCVLCMYEDVDYESLRDSAIETSYRDNSKQYWGDPENLVDTLEELEDANAVEIENGAVSITESGLKEWKKATMENDVDPNIYV